MLRDLLRHRDLLALLVRREIRIRYARALLGAGWALFIPIVMMAVFSVMNFERLIPEDSPYRGIPYTAFAYCGLQFWTQFATSHSLATPSLVAAGDLLRKCAFHRETIPASKVLASLLDLAIGGLFLVVLMIWKGIAPGPEVLAVPFILALQVVFTYGLTLLLSAGNLYFRDVRYLVQVGLLLAMFATAVVYPIEPDDPTVRFLLNLNPMSSYLNSYRQALFLGQWPGVGLIPGVVGAAASLLVGGAVFRKLSPRFAEEV